MSTNNLLVIKGVFKMADSKLKTLLLDFARYLGEKDAEIDRSIKNVKILTGQGSPEGSVVAAKDVTYIDTNRTLGAYKWVKTTSGGNTGWKVTEGDTGWVTLKGITSNGSKSFVKLRRVNDQVFWWLGGERYDLFSITGCTTGSNWAGVPGSAPSATTAKVISTFICTPNKNIIPIGFRSPNSTIGPIYNDDGGAAIGAWKLGGINDANQFRVEYFDQATFRKTVPNVRFSTVTYLTNDPWPTAFP